MMRTITRTRLRPMHEGDIPQVMDIEREAFPSSWPQTAYKRELQNKAARYLVITEADGESAEAPLPTGVWGALRRIVGGDHAVPTNERLLGFIGVWLTVGEAHIVTIAARADERRRGIGERLLIACTEMALEYDQEVITLEVRASNTAARRLYEKYGFAQAGVRKRYYSDNHEDAVIMTTPAIATAGYRALFEELRTRHQSRFPDLWA
jgi:ribosomal-protein-alanine N-acetyltransferase